MASCEMALVIFFTELAFLLLHERGGVSDK